MIEEIKKSIFLDTATGYDLSRLGANNAVDRPHFSSSDDLYRKLIPLLGINEKMPRIIVQEVVDAFFGVGSGAFVSETGVDEVVVVVPASLLQSGNLSSITYLQQTLSPVSHALGSPASPGDTTLTLVTNSSILGGHLDVDVGASRESLLVDVVTPTTGTTVVNLDPSSPVRFYHESGTLVEQYPLENAGVSYYGDYYGVARREATIANNISPGDGSVSLDAGHAIPTRSVLVFDADNPALRETFLCEVSQTQATIVSFAGHYPTPVNKFQKAHVSGSKVTYYDLPLSPSEESSVANGNNPVILWGAGVIEDLKDALDLVVASGVEVKVDVRG